MSVNVSHQESEELYRLTLKNVPVDLDTVRMISKIIEMHWMQFTNGSLTHFYRKSELCVSEFLVGYDAFVFIFHRLIDWGFSPKQNTNRKKCFHF